MGILLESYPNISIMLPFEKLQKKTAKILISQFFLLKKYYNELKLIG